MGLPLFALPLPGNVHYNTPRAAAAQAAVLRLRRTDPPFLPFGGMSDSMICDIKMQGTSAFRFHTQDKVVVERYWTEA